MEKLNYNISMPTIFNLFQFINVIKNLSLKDYNLGLFILEMFVVSGGVLKYNPLNIIEAIYLLIMETNGKEKRNLDLYNYMNNFKINLILYKGKTNNCLLNIKNDCLNVKEKKFTYLIKKFSSEKFQKINAKFQLI